jgi:ABC-2 type transport system ATP-binding protein
MNSETIIEVEGLYKTYQGAAQPAVNGISLSIRKGRFFGLLGPNGAGKTTFLSMLTGLLKLDSGRIRIAGLDIMDNLNEIKHRLSFVPQDTALYPTLTARENLSFFGSMQGLSGSSLHLRIEECLAISDLNNYADSRVDTFSGGMKRRLSLVIGLVNKPDILFLDEPTVGIDTQSRHFIYNNLRNMNEKGMTIVYTSHYMDEVEGLCDYIAIIDHGRVIAHGEIGELLRGAANLEQLFLTLTGTRLRE